MAPPKIYYNRLPFPAAFCEPTRPGLYECSLPWLDDSQLTAFSSVQVDTTGAEPSLRFKNDIGETLQLPKVCTVFQAKTSKVYLNGTHPDCGLPFLQRHPDDIEWEELGQLNQEARVRAYGIENLPKSDPDRQRFKKLHVLREAGKPEYLAKIPNRAKRSAEAKRLDAIFANHDLPRELAPYRNQAMINLVENIPEILAMNYLLESLTGVPSALVLSVMQHESHFNPLVIEYGSGIGFGLGQFDRKTWSAMTKTPVFVTLFKRACPDESIPEWGTDNIFAQILAIHVKFMNVAIKYKIPPSLDPKFLVACESAHAFGLFSPASDRATTQARSLSSRKFTGRIENIVWLHVSLKRFVTEYAQLNKAPPTLISPL